MTPIVIGNEHFSAYVITFFNVQCEIFNEQVAQVIA